MDWRPWLIMTVMVSASLSGCFGENSEDSEVASDDEIYPEPWNRADVSYDNSDVFSRVSVNGT
ncbi:MAG: hypothetical protein P8Q94_02085, partial [Candidatus Poseidoniaceae archaeon]|nr:hypothetical protein [Candidatus Poseidoniaceae archaeon]